MLAIQCCGGKKATVVMSVIFGKPEYLQKRRPKRFVQAEDGIGEQAKMAKECGLKNMLTNE